MGMGPGGVKLYLELWQRGFFKNIKSVMDMGSQELHLKKGRFEELVREAGIPDYHKHEKDFKLLEHWPDYPRLSTKIFYKLLGVKDYACLDLNGEYDAIRHDLNFPMKNAALYDKFDLVTDHGACEHTFNLSEAYRTMHLLCKPGGYLIILQVLCKRGNGYYLFDPSFFEGLAAANNYRILFASYIVNIKDEKNIYNQFHIPISRELLETLDWLRTQSIEICYVLQKQSTADFQYPYQGNYLSQIQKNFGYKLQFLPDPPSYSYVPIYSDDLIETRLLMRLLLKKTCHIIKRLFGMKS